MRIKFSLGALAIASVLWAQEPGKVDPFRQVTTQWVKPNLLIVLDISGSMQWDMDGNGVGVDCLGGPQCRGEKPTTWNKTSSTSGCSGGKRKWTYRFSFSYPSRMAVVKNALGNSVTIWYPPNPFPTVSGWTGPIISGTGTRTVSYKKTCVTSDPGPPFDLATLPDPIPPRDLVGRSADKINWGLVVYSGNYVSGCAITELVAKIDTSDSGDVTTIENWLRLNSAGGLPATGATPTRAGLEFAKTVLTAVKNGGTVTDRSDAFGGRNFSFPPDPKKRCGRSYSVLLVTDGQSNMCNPGGQHWVRCPEDFMLYPAGRAKELWELWQSTPDCADFGLCHIRTFVVGVSEEVGPCELNRTAFWGKTDASSPNGDAGFDTAADPRLATYDSSLPYAYFANNAEQFAQAVAQIIAALGSGDYVTSAPAVSSTSEVAGIGLLGTVDYPTLRGHLLAYNVSNEPFSLLWDAGEVLSSGNKNLARKVYTWKPSNKQLVAITSPDSSTANTLDTLCGNCGMTPAVVDFILGNDGTRTNTRRPWILGAILNSTPAVIGPPAEWKQPTGLATARREFQDTYKNRHPIVWVGSSDGMLHAFDLVDGAEILAIIPPDLLHKQVQLYNTFAANPNRSPTGQPQLPEQHIYGVANSMRFADVFFPQGTGGEFKTVLFLTEGPGGTGVHALDVTHIYPGRTGVVLPNGQTKDYPADPNYNAARPFEVLWGYTRDGAAGTTPLPNLRYTWGMPAVAMDNTEQFYLAMPSGYLPGDQADPDEATSGRRFLFLRATDGQVVTNQPLIPAAGAQYLSNFYPIADAAFWQTTAKRFQPDNYANQAVLGDLHGQLWLLNDPFSSLTRLAVYQDANSKGAPLYYATAVASYPMANPKWAVYASVSGNFYEQSRRINPPAGWLSNTSQYHRSKLFLNAQPLPSSGVSPCTRELQLDTLRRPDDPANYLSRRTQPTSYPLLLIPTENSSLTNALALFTVYDPDAALCVGKTYLIVAEFNPSTCSLGATVFAGGEGASSGFVVAPSGVLFAKSFVGQGGRAHFQRVPGIEPPSEGGEGASITWWRELQ